MARIATRLNIGKEHHDATSQRISRRAIRGIPIWVHLAGTEPSGSLSAARFCSSAHGACSRPGSRRHDGDGLPGPRPRASTRSIRLWPRPWISPPAEPATRSEPDVFKPAKPAARPWAWVSNPAKSTIAPWPDVSKPAEHGWSGWAARTAHRRRRARTASCPGRAEPQFPGEG